MKIGIYDPYLDTMSGGERYMLSLARCLAAEDNEVTLFWDPKEETFIRAEAERKFHMDLQGISFAANIFAPSVSLFSRLLLSKTYDKIIVLSDGSIPFLACSTILHFQTPTEWVQADTLSNRLKLQHISLIICNSNFTKRYIDKKFHIESKVLYPPVDLPEVKKIKKEKLILNLGRMGIIASGSSYKKQEVLRDAFQELMKKGGADWKMVFITNVKESEKNVADAFIASVQELPISVLVNPDMDTVKEYYKKAALYWHAAGFGEDLEKHPDRAEHFGLSTVEAMHYGAVPIVIRAGGQPEIVTDGVNGYLWDSVDELLMKTRKVINDTHLREKVATAAEKRAADFTLEKFCQTASQMLT